MSYRLLSDQEEAEVAETMRELASPLKLAAHVRKYVSEKSNRRLANLNANPGRLLVDKLLDHVMRPDAPITTAWLDQLKEAHAIAKWLETEEALNMDPIEVVAYQEYLMATFPPNKQIWSTFTDETKMSIVMAWKEQHQKPKEPKAKDKWWDEHSGNLFTFVEMMQAPEGGVWVAIELGTDVVLDHQPFFTDQMKDLKITAGKAMTFRNNGLVWPKTTAPAKPRSFATPDEIIWDLLNAKEPLRPHQRATLKALGDAVASEAGAAIHILGDTHFEP